MRLTKEIKEALFNKIDAYRDTACDKYPSIVDKISEEIRDAYNKNLDTMAKAAAEKAIKQISKKYNRTYPNVDKLADILVKKDWWYLKDECELPVDTTNKKAKFMIYDQAKLEKQNLVLKIPFLKKEEELNAYMKGIEERLNAL